MTVAQIKAIEPLAEVYEIRKEARYIVRVPVSPGKHADTLKRLSDGLIGEGFDNFIMLAGEPDIQFFEIEP